MNEVGVNIDDRKWEKLSSSEKTELVNYYRLNGKFYTTIVSAMSDILFKWVFILNSGGLIAVTTILASAFPNKNQQIMIIQYCLRMGVSFVVGLILIYIAVQIEHWRFRKKGSELDNLFDDLQNSKLTVEMFYIKTSDKVGYGRIVTLFELLGFYAFCTGLGIGLYNVWV